MSTIKVISFDGDDTLWQNENFFQKFCSKFYDMLSEYGTTEEISKKLYDTEVKNIAIYGYGAKSMMLSMIETYCKITDGNGDIEIIDKIIKQGQQLLQMPVNLLDGVKEAVSTLKSTYKLVLATKGDLTDQKRKIDESGLQKYFYHIEIMAEKNATGYRELLDILDCAPENFLMVGNSMKSDILPVLELGGHAILIPYFVTWEHEKSDEVVDNPDFRQIASMKKLVSTIKDL